MIEVLIETTGSKVGQSYVTRILLEDEGAVAVRRKNDETNKVEQLTIAQLFDAFSKKSSYLIGKDAPDQGLFEDWFSQKYIKGKSLESRILSIRYNRIS